ncbi:energy-coupling factor ABC transporter ATP-binding protein [Caviibacterium pharyngocola]|uniref:Cobalt ABC transporter ATP-binding protein n=1 Tax=Caviibacterium pharyngocola TaxID=28159 RepID=A0A2M8RW43_9PAST|nr:energy-coupling factor ABC transporter ATP-binding protein [Caviibacterium pharyngocola]PJG83100.1 cobalt ABC transporter ATP-binding protein [Caviibacterium pharyngocola]
MNILDVNQLQVIRNEQAIFTDLSFCLQDRQRLFLQGDIGSGKSTLLHSLLGFVPHAQGEIRWFGQLCRQERDFVPLRGGRVGICFQHSADQLFGPTVLDDVAFGPLNQGLNKNQAYDIALRQLERLDITRLKDRSVNTLSGGEQNFTALAGVLSMQPQVLLLDEPTNGLDAKNIAKLTALLRELSLPMIIASHDQVFISTLTDPNRDLSLQF